MKGTRLEEKEKKRDLCFTLAWMRDEACWRDIRAFLAVCGESWGYDPSQKQLKAVGIMLGGDDLP